MNDNILAWVRPAALLVVLAVAAYMEVMQLKVSEFFIGLCTLVVTWFFKSRDEGSQK